MKHLIAVLLSTLLLFSMPACVENAHAADDAASPGTDPVVSHQESPAVEGTDTGQPEEADPPASPEHTVPEAPEVLIPEESSTARVIDPEKPMVALTFDDGPHPTNTDALLDILEANGATATFFQVGQNLWKDPDAVRRAEEMGCEIGTHSYRHADLSKLSAEAIAADLKKADDAFIEVLGHAPTLLRPPYGAMNSAVKTTTGRSIITWSIDTEDWLSRNAQKVIASVQGAGDLDGQVILMHDVHATTIEAAETLIPWLIEQGYQLVTVTELITLHYGDQILPNGLYGYSYFTFGKPVILPEGQTPPAKQTPSDQPPAQVPAVAPAVDPAPAQIPGSEAESGTLTDSGTAPLPLEGLDCP